jgi:hypothetical protein
MTLVPSPSADLEQALRLLSVTETVICQLRSLLASMEGSEGWWGKAGDRSGIREADRGGKDVFNPLVFFKVYFAQVLPAGRASFLPCRADASSCFLLLPSRTGSEDLPMSSSRALPPANSLRLPCRDPHEHHLARPRQADALRPFPNMLHVVRARLALSLRGDDDQSSS